MNDAEGGAGGATDATGDDSDSRLNAAYRRTSYVVRPEGGREIVLRIDEPSATLAAVLDPGEERWAFVTAYNPDSRPLPLGENERRHEQLLDRVRAAGYRCHPGEGRGDDDRWPAEKSLFVRGIDADDARRIGTEFGQKAIVVGDGERPEIPRLLWLS